MFNSLTTLKKMKLFQKSLCNVMSHVVLFAYPIIVLLEYLDKKYSYKNSTKEVISDICNTIKNTGQNRHFVS